MRNSQLFVAIVSVMVLTSLALAQNDIPVQISDFPPGDLPTEKEKQEYESDPVDSYKYYYGIGRPIEYEKARHVAFVEFEREAGGPLGGSVVLMMLYANGLGVERNLDLSIELAKEGIFIQSAYESMVASPEAMKGTEEGGGGSFDYCSHHSSRLMLGICGDLREQIEESEREAASRSFKERLGPRHKDAYRELKKYIDEFARLRRGREIEQSSGNAGWVNQNVLSIESDYMSAFHEIAFQSFEDGRFPWHTEAEFVDVDRELNRVYSRLRDSDSTFVRLEGIRFEDVRKVQRYWIKYRDAWVQYGGEIYPYVSPESWKTWLTKERIEQLNGMGHTPGYRGDAVWVTSEEDIKRDILEDYKAFKKY